MEDAGRLLLTAQLRLGSGSSSSARRRKGFVVWQMEQEQRSSAPQVLKCSITSPVLPGRAKQQQTPAFGGAVLAVSH